MTAATAPAHRRFPMPQTVRALSHRGWVVRAVPVARASVLITLGLFLVVLTFVWPTSVSWALFAPLIVMAGLFLRPGLFVLTCFTYAVDVVWTSVAVRGWSAMQLVTVGALAITAVIMYFQSESRDRLGLQGTAGESMLVDLRDRLRSLGEFAELPVGWHAQSWVESAYGDKFSGDFVVISQSADRLVLEVALVDLSGKGAQAGTRSLLLSGALGGLLGELDPDRLLAAANAFLLRQEWDEGFATAIHVSMCLRTGRFSIGNAGHPGPVQFGAGSGRWSVHHSMGGPVLGVIDGASYPRTTGVLQRGDALVLYTDGVIESRGHDLARGLDRLIGDAEGLVTSGFYGSAQRLCLSTKVDETDDRAVVVIWRD